MDWSVSAPAAASESDVMTDGLPAGATLEGALPKDAPGTSAGLTPRLAALASGLADQSKVSLSFYGKKPGPGMRLDKQSLQFAIRDTGLGGDVLEAYKVEEVARAL